MPHVTSDCSYFRVVLGFLASHCIHSVCGACVHHCLCCKCYPGAPSPLPSRLSSHCSSPQCFCLDAQTNSMVNIATLKNSVQHAMHILVCARKKFRAVNRLFCVSAAGPHFINSCMWLCMHLCAAARCSRQGRAMSCPWPSCSVGSL